MSTASKPLPLNPPPVRKRCPVCGQTSYSSAGIHPQCAVRQADLKRLGRIKARPVPPKSVAPTP